jgi:hypothetical protein
VSCKGGFARFKLCSEGPTDYWQVRLFLPPLPESEDGAFLLWLTVDRYQVIPFLGEKPIAAFEDMTALYRHYWDEAYS